MAARPVHRLAPRRGSVTATLATVLAALPSGCTGDPPGARFTGPPGAELGVGPVGFTPLEDGAEVEVSHGVQGGWHISVAARLSNLEVDGVRLRYELRAPGGELIGIPGDYLLSPALVFQDDDQAIHTNGRILLELADRDAVVDTQRVLSLDVQTAGGEPLQDARRVTIVDRIR
jgi:hypothetical protein